MAEEKAKLPLRPGNDKEINITERAKQCLTYVGLTNCRTSTAFAIFYPEYADGEEVEGFKLTKIGAERSKQFFEQRENKLYLNSYRATLRAFLDGRTVRDTSAVSEISDDRKENALKNLLDKAISMVEGGADLDPDTLKTVSEIFKKLGLLKDEVQTEIKPLRFLPARCLSECRYRRFVENAVKGGQIVDDCEYCRALAFAREQGYRDDGMHRLDLPKEIAEEEAKNDVRLKDILDGKIEN